MVLMWFLFMGLTSIQEFHFFLFFLQFVWTLRIQHFHFLLLPGRKLW